MRRARRIGRWAALVAMVLAMVCSAGTALATTADCGGGEVELLQADDLVSVVGVRVTGIGPACDGQPVGVQFLGNPEGDPALPATELAHAYSDEDPCTGDDLEDGVLQGGAVEVLLCEGSATADHVDGGQLTALRLLTTAGTVDTPPPGTPPVPGGTDAPDGAPGTPAGPDAPGGARGVPGEDLPMTGAEILRAILLGAALVLGGTALLRTSRREGLLRR